jgi:hypothetical protein
MSMIIVVYADAEPCEAPVQEGRTGEEVLCSNFHTS